MILSKHNAATNERRFNAILATSSINDAIEYYQLFKQIQEQRKLEDESFESLNVACVFSPPAEDNSDIKQILRKICSKKESIMNKNQKRKDRP